MFASHQKRIQLHSTCQPRLAYQAAYSLSETAHYDRQKGELLSLESFLEPGGMARRGLDGRPVQPRVWWVAQNTTINSKKHNVHIKSQLFHTEWNEGRAAGADAFLLSFLGVIVFLLFRSCIYSAFLFSYVRISHPTT